MRKESVLRGGGGGGDAKFVSNFTEKSVKITEKGENLTSQLFLFNHNTMFFLSNISLIVR